MPFDSLVGVLFRFLQKFKTKADGYDTFLQPKLLLNMQRRSGKLPSIGQLFCIYFIAQKSFDQSWRLALVVCEISLHRLWPENVMARSIKLPNY